MVWEHDGLKTLWRPVGNNELALIEQADWREFPPRLSEQPIFYPVLTFAYAERIAREWNSVDPRHDHAGFVTEFDVRAEIVDKYEPQEVGGRDLRELWVPAEDLCEFNAGIVGPIRIAAEYRHGERID
jgi:hypothetical protein